MRVCGAYLRGGVGGGRTLEAGRHGRGAVHHCGGRLSDQRVVRLTAGEAALWQRVGRQVGETERQGGRGQGGVRTEREAVDTGGHRRHHGRREGRARGRREGRGRGDEGEEGRSRDGQRGGRVAAVGHRRRM